MFSYIMILKGENFNRNCSVKCIRRVGKNVYLMEFKLVKSSGDWPYLMHVCEHDTSQMQKTSLDK